MNKLMAMLFLLGVLAGLGFSMRSSYQVQDHTVNGAPVGEPRTVSITKGDRIFYLALSAACACASFYFIARIRREDLR